MKTAILMMLGFTQVRMKGFICSEDELIRELREDLADNCNEIIKKSWTV